MRQSGVLECLLVGAMSRRTTWKILVKNLGVLRQAEFSLGDLTIICGKNNTGKTYATYALYGFLAGWRENTHSVETTRITDQKVGDLLNSGITRIDLLEYVRNTDKIIGEMCESYSEFLPKIFATSKERLQDASFRLYLDEDRISESAKSLSFQREYRAQKHRVVSMSKKKESMTLEASLLVDKLDAEIPEFLVGRLISEAINEILFARFLPDTFISSAERTGIAIFRKELDFARNRLLKEMIRSDDNIDPRELLFKSYQDYALPVEKNVGIHRPDRRPREAQGLSRRGTSLRARTLRRNHRRRIQGRPRPWTVLHAARHPGEAEHGRKRQRRAFHAGHRTLPASRGEARRHPHGG